MSNNKKITIKRELNIQPPPAPARRNSFDEPPTDFTDPKRYVESALALGFWFALFFVPLAFIGLPALVAFMRWLFPN